MAKLIRDGVVMLVSDSVVGVFKRAGYTEVVEKSATSPIADEVKHDEPRNKYTKSDIMRMNKSGLLALAKDAGIKVADDVNIMSLKTSLVKKLV